MSRPDPQATAPNDPTVASSCLDFLLIELVPLAQRITDQLHARDHALRAEYARSQIFHDQPPAASTTTSTTKPTATTTAAAVAGTLSPNGEGSTNARDDGAEDRNSHGQVPASSQTDASSVGGGGALTDTTALGGAGGLDDETRDAVFWRLDGMGYRVGQGLVERFSANRPRPQSPLDNIKFICKDLWPLLFRKQIDNLKTNHRGVFVLTDQRFQPISRVSVDRKAGVKATEETLGRAQAYLYFPCGIIRGALAGLGMDVTVHADSSEIPAATFQIKTRGAKA